MKFNKELLQELAWCSVNEVLDWSDEISKHADEFKVMVNEQVDSSRWSIHHNMVFKYLEKFYYAPNTTGAT